jgi:hypothetical protein
MNNFCKDKRIDRLIKDPLIEIYIHEWTDGSIDGLMDKWIEGWMDASLDRQMRRWRTNSWIVRWIYG